MNQSFSFLMADVSPAVGEFLGVLQIILIAILIALSLALIVCILFQSSNTSGMGAIAGQSTETFYSKNKGKSLQGLLKRLTIIISIAILVVSVIYLVAVVIYPVTVS